MGLSDFFSSLFTEVHAEAPEEEPPTDTPSTDEDSKEEGEGESKEKEEEPEEEEEEEEEEPEDIKPKLEEECARSSQCRPYKHHFEECVERVMTHEEEGHTGPKEDCVEEFFHLQHCATQCAAPKLFAQLK